MNEEFSIGTFPTKFINLIRDLFNWYDKIRLWFFIKF